MSRSDRIMLHVFAAAALLAAAGVPAADLEIVRVRPEKLVYEPGETARATISVANRSDAAASALLSVKAVRELDSERVLHDVEVSAQPGQTVDVPVVWQTGPAEFGRDLVATLATPAGAVLDEASEAFTVGGNAYLLGPKGSIEPTVNLAIQDISDLKIRGAELAEEKRSQYYTTVELYCWAPDDFGNLTPKVDRWMPGQARGNVWDKRDIQSVIGALHEHGIKAVSYGKYAGSMCGLHGGRDVLELVRMHPEWAQWTAWGNMKMWFRWAMDWREWIEIYEMPLEELIPRFEKEFARLAKEKRFEFLWMGLPLNFYTLEPVDWGVRQFVGAHEMFGFDGVRFDGQFYVETLFDGGVDFEGRFIDRGEDFDELSARNVRYFKDTIRRQVPGFLYGDNYGLVYDDFAVFQPKTHEETLRNGGIDLLEDSAYFPDKSRFRNWEVARGIFLEHCRRGHRLGGLEHVFLMAGQDVARQIAMICASQGYGGPFNFQEWLRPWYRFVVRYSSLLYSQATRPLENGPALFDVSATEPVWWKDYVYEHRDDQGRRYLVLHLLGAPEAPELDKAVPEEGQENVKVTLRRSAGFVPAEAWNLSPENDALSAPILLSETADGWTAVVPSLKYWSMVVLREGEE